MRSVVCLLKQIGALCFVCCLRMIGLVTVFSQSMDSDSDTASHDSPRRVYRVWHTCR